VDHCSSEWSKGSLVSFPDLVGGFPVVRPCLYSELRPLESEKYPPSIAERDDVFDVFSVRPVLFPAHDRVYI